MTFTQRKWGDTSVTSSQRWWRYTGYLCDIHTKKMGKFHSEKDTKWCSSPKNIMVIYEIKGNKEVCSFRKNERALCDNYANLNGTVSLENWKICLAVHTWKKSLSFTKKKENIVQIVYNICSSDRWNSSTNKTTSQRSASKSSKLIEAARSSKVCLWEELLIEQIKDTSIW